MTSKALPAKALTLSLSIAIALGQMAAANAASTEGKGAKPYSPYAQTSMPERPLWGDTHLHTGLSVDAGLFGATLMPDDAYRFAKGYEVVSSTGLPARLARPLDWLVVSDHSDAMGLVQALGRADPDIIKYEQGARWSAGMRKGGQDAVAATLDLISNFSQATVDPGIMNQYAPGSDNYAAIWERVINAAESNNDPGTFTAFIGFEWTSLVKGNNLHRNVIFRDDGSQARQVFPYTTYAPHGSNDPLDLYAWMSNYETKTGGNVLALAHNGNVSNGLMFPIDHQYSGKAIDSNYVQLRAKWEPMYEVTQIKGDGETHPLLSPNDEFADYETWDAGNLDLSQAKTDDMLKYEYAREALKSGLLLGERLGTNPYKFGMIGSTDSHTGLSTAEEDNFFGKHAGAEPSKGRMNHPFSKTANGVFEGWEQVASGLAAVWARENTRESIFDAMERKEVYATTGTRIAVRLFGGWNFSEQDLKSRRPAVVGYEKGVPMGGDLPAHNGSGAPTFMVYALRDPIGANLDRIQIVKGWLDRDGNTHENVYDVVWSGDRALDANNKLAAVGNTVDVANATWTNVIGASELGTVWTDPDFDADQAAFYYARVLEIPTPRWVVYDANYYGETFPKQAQTSGQERAYTSPIWYTPAQ